PSLDVARTLWADALDSAGRRSEAIAQLDRVAPDSPFYAAAQGQIAWALRREGRGEEALSIARAALDASKDRDLKIQLGDLYRSVSRYAEADQVFSELIDTDARNGVHDWRLYYARGTVRDELEFWPGAEADLRRALELQPVAPNVLNYLGYSLVDRGMDVEEGFSLIQKAVALRPDEGHIVDSLGWAYFRLGRFDEAVVQLERAVELSPGDVVINDHLGDAYWRVGRRLEASFQWKRALSLNPEDSQIADLEAKLTNGLDGATALAAALARASITQP
ncbi:MAG: tetratricopeptide repeat protein, partial [Pseudomonadota bacterium]